MNPFRSLAGLFLAGSFYCILAGSSCNIIPEDCGMPSQNNNETVFINMPGNNESCPEVSEGFPLFLDWPYITGDDGGNVKFQFDFPAGFAVDGDGKWTELTRSSISLFPTAQAPATAMIEVFGYNECGESNRGKANVKVRKTPPYAFLPRISLPQNIVYAANFIYQGKGYIAGGLRGSTAGTDQIWIYDPAANNLTDLPAAGLRTATAAAVLGDTAYFTADNGLLLEAYHIPTNTRVRTFKSPHAGLGDYREMGVQLIPFNGKLYMGPVFSGNVQILSYNPGTGQWTYEKTFFDDPSNYCRASFTLDNRMYFFFKNGNFAEYNPVVKQMNLYSGVPISENYVTAFSVNGKGYAVTEKGHYELNPASHQLTFIPVFNGNSCFPVGWTGHKWSTSNFVLGSRVYFTGGNDSETSAGTKDFFGMQF
ncbi:MAG: hypothetical protein H6562_11750 [Lewinellaceae bacterium]|nr:hypothetical protein [Lewinellaceae bacterium]